MSESRVRDAEAPRGGGRTRLYRGLTVEQRDARRRAQLLRAALELFGSKGFAATTIADLCVRARLTQRSFYEHFQTREDLLVALYGEIIEKHSEQVANALADHPDDAAAGLRAAVAAAVRGFLEDERAARVVMMEIVGVGPRAERRRFEVISLYVEMIAREAALLPGAVQGAEARRVAVALVGTINESITDWLVHAPSERPSARELIGTLQRVFAAVLMP